MADNRFSGKGALFARMQKIPLAARVAARDELGIQAAKLVAAIKPRVPQDEGDLAESVEWRPGSLNTAIELDRISVVVTEGANDDTLGRKARANEFGRGGDNPMEARPHFFPTYRAMKRRIQNAVQRKARAAIRKVWGSNT